MIDTENRETAIYKTWVNAADLPCQHFCRKISLAMQKAAPKNCVLSMPFDMTHRSLMAAFFAFRFEKPEVLRILSVLEGNGVIKRVSTKSWTVHKFSVFESVDEIMRFFASNDAQRQPSQLKDFLSEDSISERTLGGCENV